MANAGISASNVRGYVSNNVFNGKRVLKGEEAQRQKRLAASLLKKAKSKLPTKA